jgi:hypothetical protein
MKGYLERLVGTVTNPAAAVHPRKASMFDTAHWSNVDQAEELAPSAADKQSSELASPDSAHYSEFSRVEPAHKSPTAESRTIYTAAGLTQLERSAAHGQSVGERIVFEPLINHVENSSPSTADATERQKVPTQKSERGVLALGRHTLVRGPSAVPQARTDPRIVTNHGANNQRTDEIQIHIGRIEVTAIHPPASTVPKARNKEISLDAYLKRRDWRAR